MAKPQIVKLDLTPGIIAKLRAASDSIDWCKCKYSNSISYVDDAPGVKHHWTCDDCSKITQIG